MKYPVYLSIDIINFDEEDDNEILKMRFPMYFPYVSTRQWL